MREPIKPKTTSRNSGGIMGYAGKFVNTVYKNIANNTGATKIIKELYPKQNKRID
jgi:hypothetical protein